MNRPCQVHLTQAFSGGEGSDGSWNRSSAWNRSAAGPSQHEAGHQPPYRADHQQDGDRSLAFAQLGGLHREVREAPRRARRGIWSFRHRVTCSTIQAQIADHAMHPLPMLGPELRLGTSRPPAWRIFLKVGSPFRSLLSRSYANSQTVRSGRPVRRYQAAVSWILHGPVCLLSGIHLSGS